MKVLITGGAGFIGSNVVKLLEERGDSVYVMDDFSHASYKNLEGTCAEIICADILDKDAYQKLPKLDAVIHEAAVTDTTLKDDRKMMMVNYAGFRNVLDFCLDKNIKLTYASSAGVYGNGPSPMRETQELTPHNTYGYSKCLCDYLAVKVSKKAKIPIVGLRYFNVYGPNEAHKEKSASMIYQLYLQMAKGARPRIFKFGEQKRDFIYVKDVARITADSLNLKKSCILNVGTGTARSFNDIIAALNKAIGSSLEPDYFDNPYVGLYQDYTQADAASLGQLNMEAKFSLDEGILDYVNKHLASR